MKIRTQFITGLMSLTILVAGSSGCAPRATQPPALPTAVPTQTAPPGWETYARTDQCGYAMDHPSEMDGTSQGTYSWTLASSLEGPSGPIPNFIYISVIPNDFQSNEPGAIYNYDPAETQLLLGLQVGEGLSLRADPNLAPWFTYVRLPDASLNGRAVQAYENSQPWEFPPGTKEIRYYLKESGCTYLVGGYVSTVGSGQVGAIDQALFDKVLATFRP